MNNEEEINPQDPMDHGEYLERRKELMHIREISHESYDKSILQISLVGIPLIVALFDKSLVGLIPMWPLYTTIILLGLVALLILIGFVFSKKNMEFKVKELDDRYRKTLKSGKWEIEKKSNFRYLAEYCSASSLWVFIIAIFSFSFYSFEVIEHRHTSPITQGVMMSGKENQENLNEEKHHNFDSSEKILNEHNKSFTELDQAIPSPKQPTQNKTDEAPKENK